MWRGPGRPHRRGFFPQLPNGQLVHGPRQPAVRKQRRPIELDRQLVEAVHLVRGRDGRVHPVPLTVAQGDGNGAALLVNRDAAPFCHVDVRLFRPLDVREEDVSPTVRRDLPHVQHRARKPIHLKHARLDLAFGAVRRHAEHRLPKAPVGVRHRLGQQVAVDGRRQGRQYEERREDAEDADAARLHRHHLAVARQASEAHQDPDQERHRYRQAQRVRQHRRQDLQDVAQVHADPDQLFGALGERVEHQQEGEDHLREAERGDHFPQDVATEDAKHCVIRIPGARTRRSRQRLIRSYRSCGVLANRTGSWVR